MISDNLKIWWGGVAIQWSPYDVLGPYFEYIES